ncbi:MAG: hypothetical protein ACYDA4_15020 [Ignavibacteriaceae bacterium]
MKKVCLILAGISLLAGCSSTYRLNDFSSKEKFYGDFNNFARNKNVKVTLSNDSSFSLTNGAAIENDTLYSPGEEIKSGIKKIAVSDIKEINYTSNNYNSASILLKDGESYRAKEIKMGKDSIDFAYDDEVTSQNNVASIGRENYLSQLKISFSQRVIIQNNPPKNRKKYLSLKASLRTVTKLLQCC